MKRDTIRDLQAAKHLKGRCPSCEGTFNLKDALLFRADEPIPPKVSEWLVERQTDLVNRTAELKKRRERASKRAEATSVAVNLGKIMEKIVPAFEGFGFASRDCRALFEPIDYIAFNGLTDKQLVDSITFIDVKTGEARLKENQQQIREAVESGRVDLVTYNRNEAL